ncbi:sporulation protein YpjB [Bacillus piscicola]|uniref:sporulation protein YpjB n=1 Tax=Bacillus piscicola TaxID=1632684 RepID=UPI001F08B28E|nr:sporulation protein YpjB [Bacillus piscicola]
MNGTRIHGNHFSLNKAVCAAALIALFIFSGIGQTMAEDAPSFTMDTLHNKVTIMYELVKEGRYEEAKQIHQGIEEKFPAVPFHKYGLKANQLSELLRTLERAGEAVTSVGLEHEERLQDVQAFRLAVDAVVSENHPLWKKYGEQLIPVIENIEDHLVNNKQEAARQSFQEWQRHFEVIRSAVYISEEDRYLPFMSYIRYLEEQSDWLQGEDQKELNKFKAMFKELLYGESKRSAIDPSVWIVIGMIGSVILLSLTYAGWKKYHGEKEKQQLRD